MRPLARNIPLPMLTPKAQDRFWGFVTKTTDGCWLYANLSGVGYGQIVLGGRKPVGRAYLAHRVSWRLSGRTLDPELTLDHLCRTRVCVNPDHLEQVSNAENIRRAQVRTHCYRGHELTDDNLYVTTRNATGGVQRCCKTCVRARQNRQRAVAA